MNIATQTEWPLLEMVSLDVVMCETDKEVFIHFLGYQNNENIVNRQ